MPGGLAIVTTLLLAFFTPFTGASGVTILSMGGLLLPMMTKARYPENTSIGLVTVSGSIGLLFPPSLPVILYGIYAQTPIDRLFLAGVVPGCILVLAVAGGERGAVGLRRRASTPFQAREAAAAMWEAKWELLLPVFVLAGIFGGFATLVEAAALTVLYAVVVECFVYKDLGFAKDLPRIARECATLAGGFLIILGVALAFTNYLIHAEMPMQALAWVRAHIHSPLGVSAGAQRVSADRGRVDGYLFGDPGGGPADPADRHGVRHRSRASRRWCSSPTWNWGTSRRPWGRTCSCRHSVSETAGRDLRFDAALLPDAGGRAPDHVPAVDGGVRRPWLLRSHLYFGHFPDVTTSPELP